MSEQARELRDNTQPSQSPEAKVKVPPRQDASMESVEKVDSAQWAKSANKSPDDFE